jgi:hypothetical protein
MRTIYVTLCIVLCAVAGNVSAQTLAEEVERLKQENRSLRAQVQMLQKELADLRQSMATPANADRTPPESQPADSALPPVRTYRDTMQMLRELPDHLKPHPVTGWDRYTVPKVIAWLEEHISGHRFETRLPITSVSAPARVSGSQPIVWRMRFYTQRIDTQFVGVDIRQIVGTSGGAFTFLGDELFARRFERIEVGHTAAMRGRIKNVVFRPTGSRYEMTIVLDDVEMLAPRLQ